MKNLIVAAVCAFSVVGCSHQARNDAPASAEAAAPRRVEIPTGRDAPEAPLAARWALVSDANGQLRLEAHVDIRAALPAEVSVRVQIPEGLTLVSGAESFVLPADTAPRDVVRGYAFTYAQTPRDDLKLVAEVAGPSFGIHAADAYRFGRAAPVIQPPPRSGSPVQLGGADLGRPIQIPAQ